MTQNVKFYADVPEQLTALLAKIRYDAVTPEQGRQALQQLENYIATVKVITKRTNQATRATRTVVLPAGVPMEAIDIVNRYDYSGVKSWQIKMAMPLIQQELKSRGLL